MTPDLVGLLPGLLPSVDPSSLVQVANFSWFHLVPGVLDDTLLSPLGVHDHGGHTAVAVLGSWLVCGFLIALGLLGRLSLNRARAQGGTLQYLPTPGFSLRTMFEVYVGSIKNLSDSMLTDKDSRRFFPLFGGLFVYIFFCNLLGVLPGMLPPTENVSNNFAMALVVLVVYLAVGLTYNAGPFIKHLFGPVLWLAPLIGVIELVGLLIIRPGSLSLRLMGNIVGDHMVLGIMSDLTKAIIPSIFLGLGIFVSFLQAFVFTLLSIIYLSMSIVHHDDDH
ncbi:MAG: F0F1 ATP synthase subunit A [Alphaproteobacteria bacterium]|nr:F0F1 ATP synthase subunit A [Alphaproteobacteria bacterium]